MLPLPGQQPAFRRFGLREGLPQSQVTALLEDRLGFLWVGTNTGGVARLGASGFHTFAAPQGLQAYFVRSLLEAPDGAIWVASEQGVAELRGDSVVTHGPDQGLEVAAAYGLALDSEGRILVLNRLGLLRREDRRFVPVALPEGWTGPALRFLAGNGHHGIWAANARRQLARLEHETWRTYPLPVPFADQRIRDLQLDPQGRAWVLLEHALLRMERGQWVEVSLPGLPRNAKVGSLRFDPRSNAFLIALGGDGLLLGEPGRAAQFLTAATGLPRDRIVVAIRDHRGALWVGSDGDGLAAQAIPDLLAIDRSPDASGRGLAAISGILELAPGRSLLATSTGVYLVEEPHGIVKHWTVRDGLPADETWGLLSDGRGGAWIGTDKGLAHWSSGRVTQAGPRELRTAAVLTLLKHEGRLLAGTELGLFELDLGGRLVKQHRLPAEVGDTSVTDLLVYQGHLLAATSLGLWELKGGQLVRAYADAPFATSTVSALAADQQGRLWVGTMQGLCLHGNDRWTTYGIEEGLPDESINFIVDVGGGRMAIGHNRGVTLVEHRRLHHLGRNQGLVSDETNHNGYLLDSQGRLWIGMIGGLNILRNARTFRNAPLPDPMVVDIHWPGGSQPLPSQAQVPPRPDYLDLSIDTGAPLAPATLHYEAFLQGMDATWRPINPGQSLQYRNLGAGTYRFQLRATTDGRVWTQSPPVPIRVRPAWHERWAIRGLLLLALMGLLGWLLWLRVHTLALRARSLEETIDDRTLLLARQNRALEQAHQQIKRSLEGRHRLLDMVTHDLRSPLTTILLSLDRLRDLAPQGATMLDLMEREAHRIEALVRNLLDQSRGDALIQSLKLASVLPAEVTEGFEEVLRLKAEAKGLAFTLEVSPDTELVRIHADTATLQQVMLNLFENALKFTPTGGQVGLRSRVDRSTETWTLEVWDTGRGLDAQQIQAVMQPFQQARAGDAAQGWGLGLSICQSILDAHQGELQVESQPGQGAHFRMVLPLSPMGPGSPPL